MILSNKYLIHKTIKLFCIVLFIISYTSIIAQTPLIEWQKNFGGTEDEQIRSSIKTLDGGYIAVGYTKSSIGDLMNYGGSDVLIQKFNNNGELDFQKIFGSEGDDLGNDIQQSKDGGYVIVGSTVRNSNKDIWVIKINKEGNLEWEKKYGGSGDDDGNSILENNDGDLVIFGRSSSSNWGVFDYSIGASDGFVLKISGDGNSIYWTRKYGGTKSDEIKSAKQTTDGGYVFAGHTLSDISDINKNKGLQDIWIVKLNNNGFEEWQQIYGGSQDDYAEKIITTADGGYAVAGYTWSKDVVSNKGMGDVWILKFNNNGTLNWNKNYGGSNFDAPASIIQSKDGGFVFCGLTQSKDFDLTNYKSGGDGWVVKINSLGAIEWQSAYGGSDFDTLLSVHELNIDDYILFGSSNSIDIISNKGKGDVWAIKISKNALAPCKELMQGFGGSKFDDLFTVKKTDDGGFVSAGRTRSNDLDLLGKQGFEDLLIIKYNSNQAVEWIRRYGGTGFNVAQDIVQTTDGGFVIVGYTSALGINVSKYNGGLTDIWILKINKNGILEWEKTIGGTGSDYGVSLVQSEDGGFLVSASSNSLDKDFINSKGGQDIWLTKLSSIGNVEWNKNYGGTGDDEIYKIIKANDSGYIMLGKTTSKDGNLSNVNNDGLIWILKVNQTGAIDWSKTIASTNELAYSITQTNDKKGYLLVGKTENKIDNKGSGDLWICKIDLFGKIVWEKSYGGSANDYAIGIDSNFNNGYIVAGRTSSNDGDIQNYKGGYSDTWILGINQEGNVDWQKTLGGTEGDEVTSISCSKNGEYVIVGNTSSSDGDIIKSNKGFWDIFIFQSSITCEKTLSTDSFVELDSTVTVYPNPTMGILHINGSDIEYYMVYDLFGNRLKMQRIENKQAINIIDLTDLPESTYLLMLSSEKGVVTKKIIKK